MSEPDDRSVDALLRERAPRALPGEPELDPGELLAWRSGRLDPDNAAAVEAVLARSAADRAALGELAEPVSAALIDRMVAAPPGSTPGSNPGRRVAWLGAGLALAAGVLFAVLRPGAPAAPGYTLGAVRGDVKATRAETDPRPPLRSAVFVPAGTVRITVRPVQANAPAAAARAFAGCGAGPLRAVDGGLTAGDAGAWTLATPARALFGEPPGQCVVGIALAAGSAHLEDLDTPTAAEITRADGVAWVPLAVDYRETPEPKP